MPDAGTLAHARQLVTQHDFAGAQVLLRDALARAHQYPDDATELEAEAAAMYSGVLLQLGDANGARNWAGYAHSAAVRLYGDRDRRTLHALGVLAVAQQRTGALDRASYSYRQLVAGLSAVEGPDSDRTIAAKADAAAVERALAARGTAQEVTVPQVSEWPDDDIADPQPLTPSQLPPPPLAPPAPTPRLVFTDPESGPAMTEPKGPGLSPGVAIGAMVAAVVALVAVVVATSGDGQQKQEPVSAVPTQTTAAPAGGPATELRLVDNGDNVVLRWTYPEGTTAPIIVSAALAGEPMRPLQSLPAGTQTYTMPGIDPQRNYCLTVTLAYTPEHTVMAPQVCTDRKPSPSAKSPTPSRSPKPKASASPR